MKEIGGYIEFERYTGPMLHEDGIKLNCGRNALAYILEAYDIHKIAMPKFMCDSCDEVLRDHAVQVRYYSVDMDFKPVLNGTEDDEWLYVVNFYGQLAESYICALKEKYRLIVDNAQAYFSAPIDGVPTIYTCRKFFGVADGAILYSEKKIDVTLQDESFDRMRFLMGRFERSASEFYSEYVQNNRLFAGEPIKRMSKLTENLLRGIDYSTVREKRTENFAFLHSQLGQINKLRISAPEGPFMYPLYLENGAEIRKRLQTQNIYIPTLWPAVFRICKEDELAYDMAMNILPLPVDQRYGADEMRRMINAIRQQ